MENILEGLIEGPETPAALVPQLRIARDIVTVVETAAVAERNAAVLERENKVLQLTFQARALLASLVC